MWQIQLAALLYEKDLKICSDPPEWYTETVVDGYLDCEGLSSLEERRISQQQVATKEGRGES